MFKASIGGNAGLARCDAIDSSSVLERGVACGRKDFVSELLMIKAPIIPSMQTNGTLHFDSEIHIIQQKIVQNDAPKFAIGCTRTEVPSSSSVKDLRNAHEQVRWSVAGVKLRDLLVNGLPVCSKPFALPEMKDGRGLHLAVRAYGTSLRVIEPILLRITPVGLQLKSEEPRLETFLNLAEASVVERSIDDPTMFVHRSRRAD